MNFLKLRLLKQQKKLIITSKKNSSHRFSSFFFFVKQNIIDSSPEVSLESNFNFVILQTLSLPCFPPETFTPLEPEVIVFLSCFLFFFIVGFYLE